MRFLLKTAFWLGLVAFFLPSGSMDDPSSHGIDTVTALLGAQQAVGDLGGFCERSPMACEAGGQIAAFVGARVADGVGFAVNAARGSFSDGALATVVSPVSPASQPAEGRAAAAAGPQPYDRPTATDPMATAAVAAAAVRRAAGLTSSAGSVPSHADVPMLATAKPLVVVPAVAAPSAPAIPSPAPRA